MLNIDYEELCNKWVVLDTHPELTRRPKNKKITNAIYVAGDMAGVSHEGLVNYLKRLSPRKSKTDAEKVAYYDNSYKYQRDTLTITTPGKFIKKAIPGIDDKIAEAFAIFWQDRIVYDPADFVVHIGNTREDFKQAFTKYRTTRGLSHQRDVKSISDSCMRHPFDRLTAHPSEVYASGDFFVISVKDAEGKTRARVVVSNKTRDKFGEIVKDNVYFYNYIYAADNHSYEKIKQELQKYNAEWLFNTSWYSYRAWNFLRILAIKETSYGRFVHDKHYIAPYVDGIRAALLGKSDYDCEYLHILHEDLPSDLGKSLRYPDTGGTVNMAGDLEYLTIPGVGVSGKKSEPKQEDYNLLLMMS